MFTPIVCNDGIGWPALPIRNIRSVGKRDIKRLQIACVPNKERVMTTVIQERFGTTPMFRFVCTEEPTQLSRILIRQLARDRSYAEREDVRQFVHNGALRFLQRYEQHLRSIDMFVTSFDAFALLVCQGDALNG